MTKSDTLPPDYWRGEFDRRVKDARETHVFWFSKVWDTRFSPKRLGANCFFEVVGYRPPKAGEYFVSGAVLEAHHTPRDLTGCVHWIVRPTHYATTKTVWSKGERVPE